MSANIEKSTVRKVKNVLSCKIISFRYCMYYKNNILLQLNNCFLSHKTAIWQIIRKRY